MREYFATGLPRRQDGIITYPAKRNGNTPVAPGQPHPSALAKPLLSTLQTSTASIRSETNRAGSIFTRRVRGESFRPMHLGSTTCMAICGNGARTTGWMIILHLPETAVRIKAKTAGIASHAAVRGMNRLHFAEAPRGSRFWRQTQMSLRGFEWFARGLLKAGYTREARVYPKSTEASYATRANRG